MSEMPPDPDLDDLPDELAGSRGPLRIRARDPETGQEFEQPISREELGSAFAEKRRHEEH